MRAWLDLLKKLCETPGVSGFEDNVIRIVSEELKKLTDKVEVDQMEM